jgi:hypothetical protein
MFSFGGHAPVVGMCVGNLEARALYLLLATYRVVR